jgi:hypothetical protein
MRQRLRRPNLTYRFYRVDTPYAAHLTIVSLEGEDRAGPCFSCGAACRSTRRRAWQKAALEAVQGRHFVRRLLREQPTVSTVPQDFEAHAMFYTHHPDELQETVLTRLAPPRDAERLASTVDKLGELRERLGGDHPVWFRNGTPPWLAATEESWMVLKVLIPGLQPEHGNHYLPQLGGPLWAPRTWRDWQTMLLHPFG